MTGNINEKLYLCVEEWQKWFASTFEIAIKRETPVTASADYALGLIGVRRGGKTFSCFGIPNISPQNTLYMNFEDPVFTIENQFTVLDDLVEIYFQKNQRRPRGKAGSNARRNQR